MDITIKAMGVFVPFDENGREMLDAPVWDFLKGYVIDEIIDWAEEHGYNLTNVAPDKDGNYRVWL